VLPDEPGPVQRAQQRLDLERGGQRGGKLVGAQAIVHQQRLQQQRPGPVPGGQHRIDAVGDQAGNVSGAGSSRSACAVRDR